jgi:hypothetical protein
MSAIPNLKREHVEAAIGLIDSNGVPPRREATRFQLVAGEKRYPPKYVVSLAAQQAAGRRLRADEFSGDVETNRVLQALGYKIEGTESEPVIARVVTRGRRSSSVKAAVEMLHEALGAPWPSAGQVRFTITSGGFLEGEFPDAWNGGLGWNSQPRDLAGLIRAARPIVESALTRGLLNAAAARTRFLTLGVDLNGDHGHAELVAVINCRSGKIVGWTGKSYPLRDKRLTSYTSRICVRTSLSWRASAFSSWGATTSTCSARGPLQTKAPMVRAGTAATSWPGSSAASDPPSYSSTRTARTRPTSGACRGPASPATTLPSAATPPGLGTMPGKGGLGARWLKC